MRSHHPSYSESVTDHRTTAWPPSDLHNNNHSFHTIAPHTRNRCLRLCLAAAIIGFSICTSRAEEREHSVEYMAQGTFEGAIPPDTPSDTLVPVVLPIPPEIVPVTDRTPDWAVMTNTGRAAKWQVVPAQFEPADLVSGTPPRVWFFARIEAKDLGQRLHARIIEPPSTKPKKDRETPKPVYQSQLQDPMLHVRTGDDHTVLSYWHGKADRKNPKNYPLNDFIHPLIGLDGEVLTAQSPGDHIHHRGVFWAWVRNIRKDQWLADWWMPIDMHAEPGRIDIDDGPVFSRFTAQHTWTRTPKGSDQGEPFVDERVVCRLFKTTDHGRALDIDLTLTAIGKGAQIGGQVAKDKGYSGMTLRFADASDVRLEMDRRVITAASVNHLRAKWVDWTGRFIGPDQQRLEHRSGAALMVHDSHPDYPPEWITRYYGPINVAYPGLNMLDLTPDKPLRLRYRIWIHRGTAAESDVPGQYAAYTADWQWEPDRTDRAEHNPQ